MTTRNAVIVRYERRPRADGPTDCRRNLDLPAEHVLNVAAGSRWSVC